MIYVVCLLVCCIALSRGALIPSVFEYEVLSTISHSTADFTEGLTFKLGHKEITESTGRAGHSSVSLYTDPKQVITSFKDPSGEFGEGLAYVQDEFDPTLDHLVQLTYKKRKVHFLDPVSLELQATYTLPPFIKEGWGLSTGLDRRVLVMSDGSGVLHYMQRDPKTINTSKTMKVVKAVTVHDCNSGMREVKGLNELELIPSFITTGNKQHLRNPVPWDVAPTRDEGAQEYFWANVIGTLCIAVIHPETGRSS